MKEEKKDPKLSNETKDLIDKFAEVDAKFKREWDKFEREHEEAFAQLEKLREERNSLLDEAVRAVRTETEEVSYIDTKSLSHGPISGLKKWQAFFQPEIFISIAKEYGLYEDMLKDRVISVITSVDDKFARIWLESKKVVITEDGSKKEVSASKVFEPAEDGRELSVSVYRPGVIPGFASEIKEKK